MKPIAQPLFYSLAGSVVLLLGACSASQNEQATSPAAVKQAPAAAESAAMQAQISPAPMMTRMTSPVAGDTSYAPVAEASRERYQRLAANPVQSVAEAPVSTFSIDVDTGSYATVRRLLNEGQLPPAEAVRLEELVNYFPYAYPMPSGNVPFGVGTELAVTPWNPQSRLLRIAIKASDLKIAELPAANLVFLVDVSGSMDRPDGLPLVQSTLKLLIDKLRVEDRVSLVVYAGDSSVVLEPTSGAQKTHIRAAIEQLRAGGSTAGESGIQLAYQQAQKGFIDGGINRILLATDGDFNVGVSDFESLKALAADKRKTGISLTTLGFGTGNYNEQLMEQLADAGDGNYAYIDNLREARKVLVEQLSSTLATVARDVKIQVEFNPAQVSEYRLLGYENRALKREDFSNDKVDAGDIGAGHSVTALYEVVPVGNRGWLELLRYPQAAATASGDDELAWLRIRYKTPEQDRSRLLEAAIRVPASVAPIARASEDLRFAASVAAFAQQLSGGRYTGRFDWAATAALARGSRGDDPFGLRSEFVQLVELAQSLQTDDSRATRVE